MRAEWSQIYQWQSGFCLEEISLYEQHCFFAAYVVVFTSIHLFIFLGKEIALKLCSTNIIS